MCPRATATMHCYLYEESHFWHYFGPLDTIDTSRSLNYLEPRYPPHPQASALSTTCLGTSPPWRFSRPCVDGGASSPPVCLSHPDHQLSSLPEALVGPPFPVPHGSLVAFGPRGTQQSCRFPKPDHDTQSLPIKACGFLSQFFNDLASSDAQDPSAVRNSVALALPFSRSPASSLPATRHPASRQS